MPFSNKTLLATLIGVALGVTGIKVFEVNNPGEMDNSAEDKPLYWVAPMDSNYRRDQPGKSPMGMDLIPVYEEASSSQNFGPGAVTIAPHVINNLGVRTAAVERKVMHNRISTVGYVQYNEDFLIHIHPRVEGWIEKLHVKSTGEPVQKGQALYTLYSPQLVNAQEELLIAIKRNNRALISAAKDRLRSLQLPEDFIKDLIRKQRVSQNVTFYAPQSGVVENLKIREGFYVKPGNTLMSIGKLDKVWVEAEVFENDSNLIRKGLAASMTLDYMPGKNWSGHIDYVYPTLNSKTRTLRVRLKFDNPDKSLRPNMFAKVDIHSNQTDSAILIPKEALIRTGSQDRVVLALGDGQFKSIEVQAGRVNDRYAEITAGLSESDSVVTSAQFLIDSESSKSSDFKRMTHEEKPEKAWLQGEVKELMQDHGMILVHHNAVEVWDWPEMTMKFGLHESIDASLLKPGQTLHFEVTRTEESEYTVTAIHIMGEEETQSATVTGVIKSLDRSARLSSIHRGAIDKWDRPAATVEFSIAKDIDIQNFNVGDNINFTFEVRDELLITQMAKENEKPQPSTIDHSTH
ncbi:efflux RND transporter periplasmic adaptor subunit [uncultured Pseudoteredinibacter sp.]|uniref:efflux RND transporter periplasmic adaptor subunit n=1 Tax=uncultured Pseudoteredinibacter sp. TaxID=1641701 RepID=UPI002619637F|nr:efflux RND transporter periplasmic adaptor subunit [uncultured Pseudoteredinibacter sp.]